MALTNVTFTGNNGGDGGGGGGMEVDKGTVTITNSAFVNNTISSGDGGGLIITGGTTTVMNTRFSDNQAIGSGRRFGLSGGIEMDAGTLIVTGSAFVGNQAVNPSGGRGSVGGGIGVFGGDVAVANSTFSGNQATGTNSFGGGIAIETGTIGLPSAIALFNTTIVGSAAGTGAGIYVDSTSTALVGLVNTIVAGSTNVANPPAPAVDIVGAFFSQVSTNNLIGSADGTSTGIVNTTNGNKVGTPGAPINPLLAPLADYSAGTPAPTLPDGAHLKTLALLAGSPAIGAGDPTTCARPLPTPAMNLAGAGGVDQRGVARPGIAGMNCDIGAFESRGFTLAPVSGSTPQSTVVTTPFAQPLAVNLIANDSGVPVNGAVVSYAVTPAANGAAATLSSPTATVNAGQASVTARANSTASAAGTSYTVTASTTDATSATFALTNLPPTITVSPATLPTGTVNQAYSQQLTAAGTGSVAPDTFSLASGSLPTGLTLSTSGLLSGIPTAAGSATFTVTATDANGFTGSQQYTLTISSAAAPTLRSIALTGPGGTAPPATLKVGQTAPITATGTFTDGSMQNLNGQVVFSSTNANVVKVDATGKVTGESPGTATITATLNGVSQSFTVTVGAPTAIGITVAPAPASRPSGVSIASPGSPAPAAVPVSR